MKLHRTTDESILLRQHDVMSGGHYVPENKLENVPDPYYFRRDCNHVGEC